MTSVSKKLTMTAKDMRIEFDLALKNAIELGEEPRLAQGFDSEVFWAISAVAVSYPDVDSALVKKATKTFATYQNRRRELYR